VSKDKYGYVSVDLQVFGYKNEPFVFANDVEQVFYVPDLAKKIWSVVMSGKKGCWVLMVKICIKFRLDSQAYKSTVVAKRPFLP
jgi:hypothetical protein